MTKKHPEVIVYSIYDNGGKPYAVYVENTSVFVYSQEPNTYVYPEDDLDDDDVVNHLVCMYENVTKVYPGIDYNTNRTGNSVLVHLKDRQFLYVGSTVYTFDWPHEVTTIEFFSVVGNSAVPYPVVTDGKIVVFMLDNEYCAKALVPGAPSVSWSDNAYRLFYTQNLKTIRLPNFIKIK